MPFRKKYKRYYKSKGKTPLSKNQVKSVSKIASKVYAKRTEKHWADGELVPTQIDWAGAVYHLTDTSLGDTDLLRTGDQIYLTSLQIRYRMVINSNNSPMVRMIVFQYNGNQAANPPTPTEVLQNGAVSTQMFPLAAYSKDTVGRVVKVLWDKTFQLNSFDKTVIAGKLMIKKFPKHIIQYSAGGTEPVKNSLHVCFVTNIGPASNEPSVQFYKRIRYYP